LVAAESFSAAGSREALRSNQNSCELLTPRQAVRIQEDKRSE